MSLQRRASVAGADFKKDYLNRSGNGFGRRLSLASLGTGPGKYGRAEDGGRRSDQGGLVVRHIPIVIEGREDRDEIGADKRDDEGVRSHRSPKSISVPINIVTMADGVWTRDMEGDRRPHSVTISRSRGDRSSTSSTESDNSVDVSTSRRKNDSELARKWQKLKSSSNSDNNSQSPSTFLRSPPLNELTQKRHTMSSARKTREPGVVVVKETVGADQCPVHGHHHHHHDHCHDHHDTKLRAPPLVRSNSAADERHKRHAGRPRHTPPALAPIKENIATENNKRSSLSLDRFTRSGSFRETKNIKSEARDQDDASSRSSHQPFHRRWSLRLPSAQPKTVSPVSHVQDPRGPGHHHSRHGGLGVNTDIMGEGGHQEVTQPRHQTRTQGDLSGANEAAAQRGVNTSVNFCDEKKLLSNNNVPVKPACVGILKTPGRRKTSNNRVEFLDNLQEREIPGRYT